MAASQYYIDPLSVLISATVRPIFTEFSTMMRNDPRNSTEPNELLFAGQTRVRQRTIILVVGAHWRLLTNGIEPFVCCAMRPFVKLLWPLVIRPHRSTTCRCGLLLPTD